MSDSYCRKDLLLIEQKQWDDAENAKHELEELQRRDKRLRGGTDAEEPAAV